MKRLFLLFLACFLFSIQGFSQGCTPDTTLLGTGVFGPIPAPDNTGGVDPTLGITTPICQGEYWEYQFDLVVPDSVLFDIGLGGPMWFDLISISISDTLAFTNLPSGLDYVCDPPNCVFGDDSVGCILISGITMDSAKSDTTVINGVLKTVFGGSVVDVPFLFPSPGIFEGEYRYTIYENGTGPCPYIGVDDDLLSYEIGNLYPNPVNHKAFLDITTEKSETFTLKIFDMVGAEVFSTTHYGRQGESTIELELGSLPEGMYFYSVELGTQVVSRKMLKL